jgi:hypothetical protein
MGRDLHLVLFVERDGCVRGFGWLQIRSYSGTRPHYIRVSVPHRDYYPLTGLRNRSRKDRSKYGAIACKLMVLWT